MRTPRRTYRSQRCLRHAQHAFGGSYRGNLPSCPKSALGTSELLGSVLLLFCPALLHRFRELLPARSSEPAMSLGHRGLTGILSHTSLCPASFHRLGQTTSPRCSDTATPPFGRTRSSNSTADRHFRILEKGGNRPAYPVAFRFQLCDYPVQVQFRLLFDSEYRKYPVSVEQLQLPRSLETVWGAAIHAFHPSVLCPSWHKTFCCRTFAPALPSLRPVHSGSFSPALSR